MLLLPPMRGLVALALDQNWYGARERDFVGWQRSRREVARLQGGGGGGGGGAGNGGAGQVPSCLHVLEGHTESVSALAVGEGGVLYSGSRDKTVRVR